MAEAEVPEATDQGAQGTDSNQGAKVAWWRLDALTWLRLEGVAGWAGDAAPAAGDSGWTGTLFWAVCGVLDLVGWGLFSEYWAGVRNNTVRFLALLMLVILVGLAKAMLSFAWPLIVLALSTARLTLMAVRWTSRTARRGARRPGTGWLGPKAGFSPPRSSCEPSRRVPAAASSQQF